MLSELYDKYIYEKHCLGQNAKPIIVHKLRTLPPGTEGTGTPDAYGKLEHKVSGFNTFLRKYFIDEIPEGWDYLKGTIGLVGFPPMREEDWKKLFGNKAAHYQNRFLKHKPGLLRTQYAFDSKNFDDMIRNCEWIESKRCAGIDLLVACMIATRIMCFGQRSK